MECCLELEVRKRNLVFSNYEGQEPYLNKLPLESYSAVDGDRTIHAEARTPDKLGKKLAQISDISIRFCNLAKGFTLTTRYGKNTFPAGDGAICFRFEPLCEGEYETMHDAYVDSLYEQASKIIE